MNFYKLLGISPDATYEDIKKAFYKKAKKFHPDINPDSQEIFKLITKAYQTLIDPQERRMYDDILQRKNILTVLTDKFMDFLGFTDRPKKGTNIKVKLNVSLKEGIKGVKREIYYKRRVLCDECDGCGFTVNSRILECKRCKDGKVKTKFGNIVCPYCFGKGFIIENPCKICGGRGFYTVNQKVLLSVPVGVEDGEKYILRGFGNAGINGGDYGDLTVVFKLDSGAYEKYGKDLVLRMKLPGPVENYDKIAIKTPSGEKILVKIPQEKLPLKIRVKGYGYVDKDGVYGDLILFLL